MTFTEQLSAALAARNWKPVNLASAIADRGEEVSVGTIVRWLNGENEPRLSTARVIADILGIPMDDLVPLPAEDPAHA